MAEITTDTENFFVQNILITTKISQIVKNDKVVGENLKRDANGNIKRSRHKINCSFAKSTINANIINASIENTLVDITPRTISATKERQIAILCLSITLLKLS